MWGECVLIDFFGYSIFPSNFCMQKQFKSIFQRQRQHVNMIFNLNKRQDANTLFKRLFVYCTCNSKIFLELFPFYSCSQVRKKFELYNKIFLIV